jgi:protein-L-isoaspartate(D-aspartate) O-methyltransferase
LKYLDAVISLLAIGSDSAVVPGQNYERERRRMVARQLERRGITDQRVLQAMGEVPRHEFVPSEARPYAYDDRPLPIGFDQTISQPYIVAFVAEYLLLKPTDRDLRRLEYQNILVKGGDGYEGWPEFAPFDGIVVAAALDHVPEPLISQLREGGRIVIPVGNSHDQQLVLIEKVDGALRRRVLCPVRFVPFTRKAGE